MKHKRSKKIKKDYQPSNQLLAFWRSKGFVLFLLTILAFMSVSVTKEVLRRFETKYEIEKLETEVARLNNRNTEIEDVIAMLNTSSAQDKEARVKLGMQNSGEQVIVLPNRKTQKEMVLPDSDRISYIPVSDFESNPEKWFHFFWDKMDKT